jgi:hypothetical protein
MTQKMHGRAVCQCSPYGCQRRVGWVASRRQLMVSAVEHATCVAPRQGMTSRILEPSLFYHELRLSALAHGLSEAQCHTLAADMEDIMPPPVALGRFFLVGVMP